LICKK